MKLINLASGSKGNATLLCAGNTKVLVDCGVSAKYANEALKSAGIEEGLGGIDALLLTHEHSDHIRGVKRLMAAWNIPVYGTAGTLRALPGVTGDEYFNYAGRALMEAVRADFEFEIGELSIQPFSIYHDAAEPCAFRFESHEGEQTSCAAVLTDCGHYDDYIIGHLTDLDAMLLEANHDLRMLTTGRYPMMLKRRILSGTGHLSNPDSGELLSKVFAPRLKSVLLGHLSQENNTPEIAAETVRRKLIELRGEEAAELVSLSTASQNRVSGPIEL